ncbi:DUF2950 family protein [Geobacter hydrogenophilus]|uniref:DUF2950 domain-containing protein n=1 Tax=Geobacter hydrogenophilus TaxID=40983 RepID=A0A9W6FXN9_9BACT|nr:DUF2950 domain-containing protein [Geobacter hydrogenophilus]MBT0895651.1 DUF2950 family protein [Geobacter hydrogenophilus]GLI36801.1 hypothetical protein GHYDROH2_03020 [Geobacter hydrogenophilus]
MRVSASNHTCGTGWAMLACVVAVAMIISVISTPSFAAQTRQKSFASPDNAVKALVTAVREGNEKELTLILGPGSKELISSGDEVADKTDREKFLAAYDRMNSLEHKSATTVILHVGPDNWPMPIPIVKKGGKWAFNIGTGKKEILKRRIGRNELHVIDVLDAYVDAQQEYAGKDCRGGGKVEFAQKLISSEGKRDGLYWEAKEGEPESPLGPLVARAAKEGYAKESNLSPFHGYYFKILKGQGKNAAGGAYQYVVKDRMILGFALVAYPAEYGNSGVMTFIVNQAGTVYEKNLGKNTRRLAEAMELFDPDKNWRVVKTEETPKQK